MKQTAILAIVLLILALAVPCMAHTVITVNPGGGADQTSLSAAEAALPNPLTGDYEISCAGATNDTTAVTIDVDRGGYDLYIHGDATSGIFDDSKYQLKVGAGVSGITVTSTTGTGTMSIVGLQVTGIVTSGWSILLNGCSNVTVRNCLIQDFTANGDGNAMYCAGAGTGRMFYNNVVWNCWRGINCYQSQGTYYNNTIVSCTSYGSYILKASCTAILKDNLISGSTTADYYVDENGAGTITTAKNFTADATSPDVGCASATITFVNAGGEDFHLAPAMASTMQGVDLSGTFTTDIDAATRSWWDPGADEMSTAINGIMAIWGLLN